MLCRVALETRCGRTSLSTGSPGNSQQVSATVSQLLLRRSEHLPQVDAGRSGTPALGLFLHSPSRSDGGMASLALRVRYLLLLVPLLGSTVMESNLSVTVSLGQTPLKAWHWSTSSRALLRPNSVFGMEGIWQRRATAESACGCLPGASERHHRACVIPARVPLSQWHQWRHPISSKGSSGRRECQVSFLESDAQGWRSH
jgi:hypothetical protein